MGGARHLVGEMEVSLDGAILVVCLFREGEVVEGRMEDVLQG